MIHRGSRPEMVWAEGLPQRRAVQFRRSRLLDAELLGVAAWLLRRRGPIDGTAGGAATPGSWLGLHQPQPLRRCLLAGLEPAAGWRRFGASRSCLSCGCFDAAFSPSERSLDALQGERLRREVLDRWLIKEAAIKWQRGSLASDLRFWEVSPCLGWAHHGGLAVEIAACDLRGIGAWRSPSPTSNFCRIADSA